MCNCFAWGRYSWKPYLFSKYDDAQAADATKTRASSHSQAVATSDSWPSDDRTHETRDKHRLARKPVPHMSDTLFQVGKDTESRVGTPRKVSVVTNPVSKTASVHLWVFRLNALVIV